jgi:hypothetical protein
MLCYVTTRYVDKHIEIGNDAMTMTTRGDRLKQAREGYFKSARQAAIALGVPVATYNAHEHAQQKGGRDFSPEEAQIYADRFGVKLEHLLMGISGDPPSNNTSPTIPVIGYVEPGDIVHFLGRTKSSGSGFQVLPAPSRSPYLGMRRSRCATIQTIRAGWPISIMRSAQ